ncbi:MAG: hypothetical protein LCH95_19440 [Proteobacteria bacterium]|nr:hypothetical protein [Pseudomonadota bacterium]
MNADFVKVGFTPSEDLIVRYDVRLTAIDGDEVKFMVDTVADFSIGLVGRLRASNFVK